MNPSVSVSDITELKHTIDARLKEYCSLRSIAAEHISPRYGLLWQTITTLLMAGGKRFRPYMLISAYRAYSASENIEAIISAALAQELIHQAMLVHDDIIDRDTMRYGIKNVMGQYDDLYTPLISEHNERHHLTESAAILAGDVLLSDAYQLLSEAKVPKKQLTQALAIFSHGVFEVIGGELLDTENAFLADQHISAETIARYKTASYTFVTPLSIGAALAGAPSEDFALLKQFSECIGIAYQFRDDLLGVFGNQLVTGKSTSSDIAEGKATFLIEQFEQLATKEQREVFDGIFHKSTLSEAEYETARTLLIESGAKQSVEATIEVLSQKAQGYIDQLSITDEQKTVFRTLAHHCLYREF